MHKAAEEFSRRFGDKMKKVKIAGDDIRKSVTPVTDRAAVKVKRVAKNVWQYAYRKSAKEGNI